MEIVLAKLMAFQKTGSDKHLRDARGVLAMQWGQISIEAIRRGAILAGVSDQLDKVVEAICRETEQDTK